MQGTTDNSSYFKRVGTKKGEAIKEFVSWQDDIEFVFDVGCNNGDLSYPLQKELGKRVKGIDLSESLTTPSDYDFVVKDITKDNSVVMNDCTLFLSLYHHLLWACGVEEADDVFYRLLLRTKYMIFDSGNVSERSRRRYPWYGAQKQVFKSEADMLDHFGVQYEVITQWNVGGGTRSVVVFKRDDLIDNMVVLGTYHRRRASREQKWGLCPSSVKNERLFRDIVFRKLEHNGKLFFSKKRKNIKHEKKELENIIKVYDKVDPESLIKFYGYSDKYGLIFEWLDDFKYIGRKPLICGDLSLKDVDQILVDGVVKYIDFER